MPSETLRVEITDGVALLTLNRPESLNALNRELFGALGEALQLVPVLVTKHTVNHKNTVMQVRHRPHYLVVRCNQIL